MNTWYSLFPIENEDLIYGTWEDDIIWDPEAMPKIPEPKMLTLDLNDENIILSIPEDIDPGKQKADDSNLDTKASHSLRKKSKIVFDDAGSRIRGDTSRTSKSPELDPFNISNDRYI